MMETVQANLPKNLKLLRENLHGKSIHIFPQNNNLLILGMHRSGTSCLTGILGEAGLYLGQVTQSDKYNKKGNQESQQVVDINDRLLSQNQGSWYNPEEIEDIPLNLRTKIQLFKAKMFVDSRLDGKNIWATKDPRMVFCWPAWIDPNTSLIGTCRHPYKVAKSLQKRKTVKRATGSSLTLADWQELWFKYNAKLIELYQEQPFPILNFDWDGSLYQKVISHFVSQFDLTISQHESKFFDESLIHENEVEVIKNTEHKKLYDKLQEITEIERKKLEAKFQPELD